MRVPSLGKKKKNTGTTLSPLTCKRDFTFSSASLLSYTLLLLLSPSARLKSRSRIGLSDRLKTLPFNPPTALLFSPNLSLSFSLSLQSIRSSNLGNVLDLGNRWRIRSVDPIPRFARWFARTTDRRNERKIGEFIIGANWARLARFVKAERILGLERNVNTLSS